MKVPLHRLYIGKHLYVIVDEPLVLICIIFSTLQTISDVVVVVVVDVRHLGGQAPYRV